MGVGMVAAGSFGLFSMASDRGGHPSKAAKTVVLVADPHMQTESERDEGIFTGLVAAVISEKPDLVLNLGDVAESGSPDEYDRYRRLFVQPFEKADIPLHEVLGNHDNLSRWRQAFGDRGGDSVVTCGGVSFLLLAESTKPGGFGRISDRQLAWIEGALTEHKDGPCYLVLHHPLVEEVGYRTWRPEGWTRPYFYAENGLETVRKLTRFKNFAGVFSGHLHANRVRVNSGVLQMAAAPCCSRTVSTKYPEAVPFGYWVLRVTAGGILGQFKESDPELAAASRRSNPAYYGTALGDGIDRGFDYDVFSGTIQPFDGDIGATR